MSSAIGIILVLVSVGIFVVVCAVRARARRMGDWKTVGRLNVISLSLFVPFFAYCIVTGDTTTRLTGGASMLIIVVLIAALRHEQPRV